MDEDKMVDAVARAIQREAEPSWIKWDELSELQHILYVMQAKAAIEAMEPFIEAREQAAHDSLFYASR
jgi:hypothetical protein